MAVDTQATIRTQQAAQNLGISAEKWRSDWLVFFAAAALGAGMLWFAGITQTVELKFTENLGTTLVGVFSSMLLVSLFVERVIEVFVSLWSDRQSAVHEQNLEYWQSRQARLKDEIQALVAERNGTPAPDPDRKAKIDELLGTKRTEMESANANADIEEKSLLPFQARTRKVSSVVGLVVGILAAAVGFRFFSQIVVLNSEFRVSVQYSCFVAADVLLTGAVLAGGSKLIHKIFSVYESFMTSTQKSLSDKSKSPAG
jgi:hypothetical protein